MGVIYLAETARDGKGDDGSCHTQEGPEQACLGDPTIPASAWDCFNTVPLLLKCWVSLGGG